MSGQAEVELDAIADRALSLACDDGVGIRIRRRKAALAFVIDGYADNFSRNSKTYGFFTADEAKRMLGGRLQSALGEQRAQAKRCGGPPIAMTSPEGVDLSRYSIERPVLRSIMAGRTDDEARSVLRRAIFHGRTSANPGRPSCVASDNGLKLHIVRGTVCGEFSFTGDAAWRRGEFRLAAGALPDTMVAGLKGQLLRDVVAHPWIDGDLEIADVRYAGQDRDGTRPTPRSGGSRPRAEVILAITNAVRPIGEMASMMDRETLR